MAHLRVNTLPQAKQIMQIRKRKQRSQDGNCFLLYLEIKVFVLIL